MKELISYPEALEAVLSLAPSMPAELISLEQSVDRVVFDDVRSSGSIPPFDNSAMDGFAVIAADVLEEGVKLTVIEEIPAGAVPEKKLRSGTCARIMTGALVPEGATAVVPVEWTESPLRSEVVIRRSPKPGQHIRLAGADISVGDLVSQKGDQITPARLGLFASAGLISVTVSKKPIVAIVATGDELVEAGEEITAGKIRNSNGPTLSAQARAAGAEVFGPHVARDSMEAVEKTVADILESDILVFAGGVSVGDYDFVQESLERRGMNTIFWRVKQRPGKPLLVGELNGKPVIGLPGNPVSASVCFEMYVHPLIRRSLGVSPRKSVRAKLRGAVEKKSELHYFSRGLMYSEDAQLVVELAGSQASNIFSTMAKANCVVHLPEGVDRIEDGAKVDVTPLPWSRL